MIDGGQVGLQDSIPVGDPPVSTLFYGDNLEVLRKHIATGSIDLCYIDPPFNSKKNYNQIYTNTGNEDKAQAQAFVDTWTWDRESMNGLNEIMNGANRYSSQTVELIKGLHSVLGKSGLLSYLVSMTRRVSEIHRVLKNTGTFYLHCDPTSSHYLKLMLDSVFCSQGGNFLGEVIWHYKRWPTPAREWQKMHDVLLVYTKNKNNHTFNTIFGERSESTKKRWKDKSIVASHNDAGIRIPSQSLETVSKGTPLDDVWDMPIIAPVAKERLGYPTQKPEKLLERIITASSNEGDTILDAYCGCGTSIAVAQKLNRKWIGIDITYQAISVIQWRFERDFNKEIADSIILDGIPKDIRGAEALANKKDDRLRKEFEKWAILTYTGPGGRIKEQKGADCGVDGYVMFHGERRKEELAIFQVKSGHVSVRDIRDLRGAMEREKAKVAALITLESPSKQMRKEALDAGTYMGQDRIWIVTIQEILENNRRFWLPISKLSAKTA